MNNFFVLAITLIAGFATGVFFFGGLWFTVQKGMTAKAPAVWFVTSFVIRVAVTLVAFYYAGEGIWQRLLLCLAGFLIARIVVTKYTRNKQLKTVKEEIA
ncbi:MAG TPA: ATP synthase subunit I [Chitinophagaceae bacterium]|nr:ATP synthase subunit I [Chitinophagaceae bacterium]